MMNSIFKILLGLCIFPCLGFGIINLDDLAQEFVLERKQIKIPLYTEAFNPSIVRVNGRLLLSFRVIINANNAMHSQIGLVWLDEDFNPVETPTLLNTRERLPLHPSKSEDARLFMIEDELFIIYNDNEDYHDYGLRRMYFSKLYMDDTDFYVFPECINKFDGESDRRWEKNWIPFDYNGTMLLAYSIVPHKIFMPIFGTGACELISNTNKSFHWPWGRQRIYGGTPALKVNENSYLAFFHSSCHFMAAQTGNWEAWHYFMGAYLFNAEPPFALDKVSPAPIIGRGMYDHPLLYKRVIYPGGYVMDDNYIWLVYGREDCQCWVLKLDKKGLLKSLIPVSDILEK